MFLSDLVLPLVLYTDGSASAIDRIGAWAWLAVDGEGKMFFLCGQVKDTTSNRMEMKAWAEGLRALLLTFGPLDLVVYSDSKYVGEGALRLHSCVANSDLWKELHKMVDAHDRIRWVHVRSHRGNVFNEFVDHLANITRKQQV